VAILKYRKCFQLHQFTSKVRAFMRPTSKPGLILLAIVAALYWVLINFDTVRLDKMGNPSTRLSLAPAAEPVRESSGKGAGHVGETYEIVYPQPPVDNSASPVDNSKRLVHSRATARGYDSKQLKCLFELIDRESSWNAKADNPHSTAFGLFQQLNLDPAASKQKQIRLGLTYVQHRYGTACAALKHHDLKGWY
jgi:hypothetical protein